MSHDVVNNLEISELRIDLKQMLWTDHNLDYTYTVCKYILYISICKPLWNAHYEYQVHGPCVG